MPRLLYINLSKSSFKNVLVDDQKQMLSNLEKYFQPTTMNHVSRIRTFFLFQFLNLFVVMLHIVIANSIMKRNFVMFGFHVLSGVVSPYIESVFPKEIACNIKIVATNGKQNDNGVICLVNINYINEVIFCIVYIWLMFLILAGVLNILYICLQLMPCFQIWSMENTSESTIEQKKLRRIAKQLPWATRLVWIQVASVLPTNVYSELIIKIVQLVPKSKKRPEQVERDYMKTTKL